MTEANSDWPKRKAPKEYAMCYFCIALIGVAVAIICVNKDRIVTVYVQKEEVTNQAPCSLKIELLTNKDIHWIGGYDGLRPGMGKSAREFIPSSND